MNYDGYIVSFAPGSRGRFITQILNKLTNHTKPKIIYTEFNSAHNNAENSFIRHMFSPTDFSINRKENPYNSPEIITTTNFPSSVWDKNPFLENKKILIISIDQDDLVEVILNDVIKNIFPRLFPGEEEKFNEREVYFMTFFKSLFKAKYNITLDYSIITDEIKTKNFLDIAINETHFKTFKKSQFLNTRIPNSEKIFNIKYNEMFKMTDDGKYKTLIDIANFSESEYTQEAHDDYDVYAKSRYDVFKKYYPSFFNQ